VCDVVNRIGLRAAQLHGGETLTEVAYVRERVPAVIQAFAAGEERLLEARDSKADIILLDSGNPGSGTVFDWALVEGAPAHARILLAGGLDPRNVATAVRRVRPWGVDVATGVEASQGRKDPTKVRRFVEAAREAAAEFDPGEGWEPSGEPPYDWMADR